MAAVNYMRFIVSLLTICVDFYDGHPRPRQTQTTARKMHCHELDPHSYCNTYRCAGEPLLVKTSS